MTMMIAVDLDLRAHQSAHYPARLACYLSSKCPNARLSPNARHRAPPVGDTAYTVDCPLAYRGLYRPRPYYVVICSTHGDISPESRSPAASFDRQRLYVLIYTLLSRLILTAAQVTVQVINTRLH